MAASANDAPSPQFMITSPEMADYLNRALDMLRRGESIDGFAEKHKAEWKARQEAFREEARRRGLYRDADGELRDADILPFFSPTNPIDKE